MIPPRPAVAAGAVKILSSLLEQRTGQQVAPGRAYRIDSALQPLVRARGLASVEELASTLVRAPSDALADAIVDALLNQETSFFRDAAVIDNFAQAVTALKSDTPNRRPRIWSAGYSSGQEPLSLAILLAERAQGDTGSFADIVATDVSAAAITRARAARYSQFEIQRGLPMRRMVRWFEQSGEDWVASPEIVAKISFRRQNLVADPPPPGQFDAILCRNVLMYFSPAVRRGVFDRLASALRPGGLLVLGAGETVIGHTDAFTPSRRFRGCYDVVSPATMRTAATR